MGRRPRPGYGGVAMANPLVPSSARDRPLLRGWLHAAVVPLALLGLWALWLRTDHLSVPGRLPVFVFGVSLVGLYTVSSVYHVPRRWSARVRDLLCRCDGAMIQLFIIATFTPVAFYTLSGPWRVWSLTLAWVVGVVGAVIAVSPLRAPPWVAAAAFVAVGWLLVIPLVRVAMLLPWEGTGLIAVGGVLYTLGALVYARRWPDPLPRVLGYHEVFHLLVVAASAVHYVAIWRWVLPGGS